MQSAFAKFLRVEFPPPQYLMLPTAGIDVSTSGIKVALLTEEKEGLKLSTYGEELLPAGSVVGGDIADRAAVVRGLVSLAKKYKIKYANIALPEARGYIFESEVAGGKFEDWRTAVEGKIDEYVPLPPAEVVFDIVPMVTASETTHVVGVGYARRVVEESLQALDEAGIEVRAIESENFALPRALLRPGDQGTALIIDIGKTTTKLLIVSKRVPRFTTTLDIGGHALTLAVQKYFGVTEEEARTIKAEKGIVSGAENEEYLGAMLSTVSVMRDEILQRLSYWQTHSDQSVHEPVSRVILVGGNATVRGLPEYFEASFKLPVELGDVFANLASRNDWLPPLDYTESLAYGTAIGLALRNHAA